MRRITILLVTLGLVVGVAAPASATHGEPVDGLWWAIDAVDGSLMIMRVTEQGGDSEFFTVVLTDFWATGACSPPSVYRGRSTSAMYDDGTIGNPKALFVTFDHNRCFGRSTPTSASFDVRFGVVADDQTLSLDDGTLFHHIRG